MSTPKGALKTIPIFKSESEERAFWADADSTEYVDWPAARAVRFSNLRPSTHSVEAMTAKTTRCTWAGSDELMQQYHDSEWGIPQHDSRMLWEMLMLEGFQAGLAWITVLRKRDAFRKAFAGFDPRKVAKFTERDITRLMNNPGIIRARAKIEATIRGAQIYCEMAERGQSFDDFCWSFTKGTVIKNDGKKLPATSPLSERISKEVKARGFKFVGPTIVYAWMQAVGIVNDHSAKCFRRG
jgi:DNA-3-methyladenine glycosylase I